jgi:NhaP-type Na+/H+ or K+/H+ antiporter
VLGVTYAIVLFSVIIQGGTIERLLRRIQRQKNAEG